jgi:CYTH domain-containing protein/CHAD domain-containing protein
MEHSDAAAAGVEIERKFLVVHPPADLAQYPSRRIEQGYLAVDPEGAVVRLRRRGEDRILTFKAGYGIERAEEELDLDAERFERLWPITLGRRVEKVRYEIPAAEGLTIELDVYEGPLAGLVTAEIEAPSRELVDGFAAPPWMRLDVSDDRRYGNASLAAYGIPRRPVTGEHGLFDGEPVAGGIVAVALGELDVARQALGGGEDPAKAVHSARKIFKRVRAIIRLMRPGLGTDVAARDNAALRDAGRRLAGARDAKVVLATLDRLIARAPEQLDAAALAPLRDLLAAEHVAAETAAAHDAGAIAAVLDELATVHADISRWELGLDAAALAADGLGRVHRKGRKALRQAREADGAARTEAMHELRKRAKDLWHAAELLEAADPERLALIADEAHELADLIGDDHDLAVLLERADERSGTLPPTVPLDALHAVATRRRKKLQRKAMKIADALYGDDVAPVQRSVHELPATELA